MSRLVFAIALILSLALHVWLLSLPPDASRPPAPRIVPVVETELEDLVPPPAEAPSEPEPEAAPEPEPAQPEPEPEAEPEPPARIVKAADPQKAETEEPGDLAGDPEGRSAPALRIDWGSDTDAMEAMDAGGMVVVVLDTDGSRPVVDDLVDRDGNGAWHRRPFQPSGATTYSNRLRIVDRVPAFEPIRRAIEVRVGERLAVLLPMRVERMLESAQMEAAFDRGIALEEVDDFAGRFVLRGGRLRFDITHVRGNPGIASP